MGLKTIKAYLSILFILFGLTTFGQNQGTFTSIQGNLDRLADNVKKIGIKNDDTIIFDMPYYHMELFKMDSTTIDTFDTVEPSMLRSIYELMEKVPNVFLTGIICSTDGYRFFKRVLDTEAKEEMLPILKQMVDSSYRPEADSLYFVVFGGILHPTDAQRKELLRIATPHLSDLQLEVFNYLMTNEGEYLPLDFWLEKNTGNSSMFDISTTKYTAKIPRVDYYAILLEEKRTKCWKYQMKKLRKEFGVRRREAFAGNVVTKDGLTVRFY